MVSYLLASSIKNGNLTEISHNLSWPTITSTPSSWDIDRLYQVYLDLLLNLAKTRLFGIIDHADVIKKFGSDAPGRTRSVNTLLKESG